MMNSPRVWNKKNAITAGAVTLFCFVCTYLFWGFYRVEYEGLITAFFSGSLTPGQAFKSLYFSGTLGISHLYSFLYTQFPGVEWMSWFEYAYLFISCLLGLYLTARALPPQVPVWARVVLLLGVYLLVFADHTVQLLYTRVAYMVCGTSLLALLFWYPARADIRQRPLGFILLNLFFALATFTRVEAAVAVFFLLLCFALCNAGSPGQVLRIFLFPALVVFGLSAYLAVDIRTAGDREFYKQVEPDIEEQFIARGNRVPLSAMKTRRDSVIYQAALDMMWSDPQVISPKRLRSFILPEKFLFTDARQWQRVFDTVDAMYARFWYLVGMAVVLGLVFLLLRLRYARGWPRLLSVGFVFSFWVLMLLQTYTDKINERSFMPLLSLYLLCLLLGIARERQYLWRGAYLLLLLLVVGAGYQGYRLKGDANRLRNQQQEYAGYFKHIAQAAGGRYLVVNSTVFDYLFLGNGPFQPYDFSAFRRMYITDGYIIPFLPYYKKYLEAECACDIYAFPSFWRYLLGTRQEVAILSNAQRMQVTETYLRELYGIQLPLVRPAGPLFAGEEGRPDAARLFYLVPDADSASVNR